MSNNYQPHNNDNEEVSIAGDILRASYNAATGVYTLENNGSDGTNTTGGAGNTQGPGNGEFYLGDTQQILWWSGNTEPATDDHKEKSQGGLALLPGSGKVTMGTMNPKGMAWTSGVAWLSNTTGALTQDLYITDRLGKANGMGDIEIINDTPPIEIGNRVWLDSDNDGLQDAGEAGIAGVQVKLMQGATELASATTAADGSYAFSSATGTTVPSHIYGLSTLVPNATYTVKFPLTVTVSGTNYNLTTASAGSNREVDSNAPATGEVSVTASDIPQSGANNYSFDVGYGTTPPAAGCTTITNIATVSKLTETDPTAANNSASATIQANCVTPKTDLKLSKKVSKSVVRHGDAITYTITLTNESDVAATGVQVEDQLPTGLTLVTATPSQGTFAAGIWNVGTVAAHATLTLTLAVTVD